MFFSTGFVKPRLCRKTEAAQGMATLLAAFHGVNSVFGILVAAVCLACRSLSEGRLTVAF
jgi:hypothetical protein